MELISREQAVDALEDAEDAFGYLTRDWREVLMELPSIHPELGTNLAEVGTDRAVKGFPIDADDLMLRVEEKYGFRSRDRLYDIIRKMPKYELASIQPEIIYCGDCKYKDDGIDEDGIPFLKCLHGRSYGGTRINDFCSWAERREVTT